MAVGQSFDVSWTVLNSVPDVSTNWYDRGVVVTGLIFRWRRLRFDQSVHPECHSPAIRHLVHEPPFNHVARHHPAWMILPALHGRHVRLRAGNRRGRQYRYRTDHRDRAWIRRLERWTPRTQFSWAGIFSAEWSPENRGTVATFADWQDHILISDDPYLGPADRLLTTVPSADVLGVGQQYANQVTVNIPNDLTPGDKYLLVLPHVCNILVRTRGNRTRLAVP